MATTKYLDNDGVEYEFQQEDGDGDGEVRSVVGFPATVRDQLLVMAEALEDLAGIVSGGRFLVTVQTAVETKIDALGTLLTGIQSSVAAVATAVGTESPPARRIGVDLTTTVTGYLANLANIVTYLNTLQGAVVSGRVAVDLATTINTYLSNLPTLVTNQAAPSATYGGKVLVTTAGTRVQLSASSIPLTEGAWIRGLDLNTGLIYPGNSTISATAGGTRIAAKESVFGRCNDANKIYIDAAVNGEGVTWWGW